MIYLTQIIFTRGNIKHIFMCTLFMLKKEIMFASTILLAGAFPCFSTYADCFALVFSFRPACPSHLIFVLLNTNKIVGSRTFSVLNCLKGRCTLLVD